MKYVTKEVALFKTSVPMRLRFAPAPGNAFVLSVEAYNISRRVIREREREGERERKKEREIERREIGERERVCVCV